MDETSPFNLANLIAYLTDPTTHSVQIGGMHLACDETDRLAASILQSTLESYREVALGDMEQALHRAATWLHLYAALLAATLDQEPPDGR